MKKIKLLNITGWGRSGSTILGGVLGEVEDFFYGGEIRNLWNKVLEENRICGCGKSIKECNVWKEILTSAFGDIDKININEMQKLMKNYTRNRHLPLMMIPATKKYFKDHLKVYISNLEKLFSSLQKVTNCSVIVDSSKSSAYSYVLTLLENIDLYTIHLVRDPRGVNYSHQKIKTHTEEKNGKSAIYMKQFNSLNGSFIWDLRNIGSELLLSNRVKKHLLLRYEDFTSAPKKHIEQILKMIGEENKKTSFISEHDVKLGMNHAVWGNPSRFKTGIVEIKTDEEWKKKLSSTDKAITTFLTWPLLVRYEYLL